MFHFPSIELIVITLGIAAVCSYQAEIRVEIPSLGVVVGSTTQSQWKNRTIYQFRGVPYAEPPSGKRRFLVSAKRFTFYLQSGKVFCCKLFPKLLIITYRMSAVYFSAMVYISHGWMHQQAVVHRQVQLKVRVDYMPCFLSRPGDEKLITVVENLT